MCHVKNLRDMGTALQLTWVWRLWLMPKVWYFHPKLTISCYLYAFMFLPSLTTYLLVLHLSGCKLCYLFYLCACVYKYMSCSSCPYFVLLISVFVIYVHHDLCHGWKVFAILLRGEFHFDPWGSWFTYLMFLYVQVVLIMLTLILHMFLVCKIKGELCT